MTKSTQLGGTGRFLTAKRVVWSLVLLAVVLLTVWGVRLAQTGQLLLEHLSQVQALADAPAKADPAAACTLVREMQGDVMALERQVGGLVQMAPALGWLPKVGGDLQAAPHLLAMADGLTEAGTLACDALEPALATFGGASGFSLEQMVTLLAEHQADLEQARAAVEQAQEAWAQVDPGKGVVIAPLLEGKTTLLDQGLSLLGMGLEAATVAPDLLGMDEPRTYLVLALNEDELRPGGGFVTGVGEVWLEAGQLVTMTFRDSYTVDDFTQPYPDPPEPLRRYMGIDLWVFRDSNWSPDFPTAARQAISLYRPGYPVSVDGVIALDQQAVQGLVDGVGPLTMDGTEEPVTGETVIAYVRHAWAPEGRDLTGEWWGQRKSFMGPLAEAAWGQVQGGKVDWVTLAQTLLRLLEEKHLLIYLRNPDAAALLSGQGWDGALRSGPALGTAKGLGDFLMVVDANVGYNKASTRVQETISYQVDLHQSPPQATLTLVYTHTSSADYPCRPEIRYDPVYEQMTDRCYWDYLRIYIPQGSQLLDATRIPVPGEALFWGEDESGEVTVQPAEEGPWLTLAALGLLPPAVT
ncbi:MAG: DUF4012 domain-containing protein, partial [Chloroflexota bacterium]|nr:DUF4012 domain-containing protein [Chloroflexota bacterium]